eukprot:CAMPEP_0172786708 /NCGR_PEP_ID=MMETSP1074-20121228/206084_1 /TAXON_ID=2916 /ORGANISM="Ceratium fusus, Strain PA161109" /LENGTH=99 /DNA_ID=CAMNT_0013623723 /DNA_START=869 /DNA_END=1168 /DNA_ORIENTATION=-
MVDIVTQVRNDVVLLVADRVMESPASKFFHRLDGVHPALMVDEIIFVLTPELHVSCTIEVFQPLALLKVALALLTTVVAVRLQDSVITPFCMRYIRTGG